ncbi:hypothetical protein J7W19_29125 [Streptomyces mobaraensis NBRC 13819 = DSM 40847]|uniref:Scaffolding protein n=1 Tax=Streptomyces mobaraensis (strain ATCC 29032 / DSM 40847 / JCM 4168 / NBRC 13819 / NCIMB 11159 / IPCR 16-22) TaxID=1223523 RepID=M3AB99_STRM1|nr:hypothetical protein [Streptomyces mobaraensis]EMF02449.1 hypothetical protein H340_01344 [Streptomyces mobaraensis NBRC 13819 = DSM 40847]QTT76901.1 hypothetical protein J7W19_29125 [Streptomyces mobaraensis NBRC 13819 = DSM 40847]
MTQEVTEVSETPAEVPEVAEGTTPVEETTNVVEAEPESPAEVAEEVKETIATGAGSEADFKERYEALAAEFESLKSKFSDTSSNDEADKIRAELDAATGRVAEVEQKLLRQTIANEFSLPAELVERLQGADYESIATDAKKLSAIVHAPRGLGKGGLDPSEKPFNPKGLVQAYRRGVNGGL